LLLAGISYASKRVAVDAREVSVLMFRQQDRERVARGEITVTFRLWKSAHVKAGKRYPTGFGTVEVEDVQVIPAALVSRDDVPASGCESVAAILALVGEHTQAQVTPETLLHRVQFRFLGDVAPDSARAPVLEPAQLAEKLARMDRLSSRGPWTRDVLRLIEAGPRVPARVLAAEMRWETLDFKAHVRRLKALGLTISHEVGYELSPLGRSYLASTTKRDAPARREALKVSPRATPAAARRSARTRPRSR